MSPHDVCKGYHWRRGNSREHHVHFDCVPHPENRWNEEETPGPNMPIEVMDPSELVSLLSIEDLSEEIHEICIPNVS
jgi:hypothetical protein